MSYSDPPADQLRSAAIIADVYLRIDAAQLYGLVEGGPEINVDRCQDIIDQAHAAGHVWTEDEVDAAIPVVVVAHMTETAASS